MHVAEFIFSFNSPGSFLGRVCPAFAKECALPKEAVVGASMIDAHAGALGMLGMLAYSSALQPGLLLLEGSQSAGGKLVDHIIDTHPASAEAKRKAGDNSVYCFLDEVLETMKRESVRSLIVN